MATVMNVAKGLRKQIEVIPLTIQKRKNSFRLLCSKNWNNIPFQ